MSEGDVVLKIKSKFESKHPGDTKIDMTMKSKSDDRNMLERQASRGGEKLEIYQIIIKSKPTPEVSFTFARAKNTHKVTTNTNHLFGHSFFFLSHHTDFNFIGIFIYST